MLAHEVLDLVSDDDLAVDSAPPSTGLEARYDSPPLPPSSPRRKRRKLALVEPDAATTDDALSVISLSDTEDVSPPRVPPSLASTDGELSEVEEAVLTPSAAPPLSSVTPSTASSQSPSSTRWTGSKKQKQKKRAVVRYFGAPDDELRVQCQSCGQGGHEVWDCPQEPTWPPCYICGRSTHDHVKGEGCPHELCWHCGGAGHQRANCSNARFIARVCYRCGSTSHEYSQCTTPPSSGHWDLSSVHCYVCGAAGHLNCAPPSLSSTPLHCCNCASSYHSHTSCRLERMRTVIPIEDYSKGGGGGWGGRGGAAHNNSRMECYNCGQLGHGKRDCPENNRGRSSRSGMTIVGRSGGAGGLRLSVTRVPSPRPDRRNDRSDRHERSERSDRSDRSERSGGKSGDRDRRETRDRRSPSHSAGRTSSRRSSSVSRSSDSSKRRSR